MTTAHVKEQDLTVVILNYRRADLTAKCLASVRAAAVGLSVQVVIVDNDSSTYSRSALACLDNITLVTPRRNLGFAGGMNLGASKAVAPYLAVLNNDVEVSRTYFTQALARLAATPTVGAVGGPTLWSNSSHPAFDETNPRHTVHRVDPRSCAGVLTTDDVDLAYVASLDGAAIVFRRALWDRLHGFDEDYFMYGEDVDLAARAHAVGASLIYDGELLCWHARGASSDRLPFRRSFWARRNQYMTVAKHMPTWSWLAALGSVVMQDVLTWLGGKRCGLRGRARHTRVEPRDRWACGLAAGWVVIHMPLLVRKRRANMRHGTFSETWCQHAARMPSPIDRITVHADGEAGRGRRIR